jgi:TctA family transporter
MNRMGVLYLMAHLLITLVVIGGYIYSMHNGQPDETLKGMVILIMGYWFGAVGMDKIKGNKQQQETVQSEVAATQETEVK